MATRSMTMPPPLPIHNYIISTCVMAGALAVSSWAWVSQTSISQIVAQTLELQYYYTPIGFIPKEFTVYLYHATLISGLISTILLTSFIYPLHQAPNLYKQLAFIVVISHALTLPLKMALKADSSHPGIPIPPKSILGALLAERVPTCPDLSQLLSAQALNTRPLFSPLMMATGPGGLQELIPLGHVSFARVNAVAENLIKRLVLAVTQVSSYFFCHSHLTSIIPVVVIMATIFWFYLFRLCVFQEVESTFEPQTRCDSNPELTQVSLEQDSADQNDKPHHQPHQDKYLQSQDISKSKPFRTKIQSLCRTMVTFTFVSLPLYIAAFTLPIHSLDFVYSFFIPGLLLWINRDHMDNLIHDTLMNYIVKHAQRFETITISHDIVDPHAGATASVPDQSSSSSIVTPGHSKPTQTDQPFGQPPHQTKRRDQLYYENNPGSGNEQIEISNKTYVKRPIITSRILGTGPSPTRATTSTVVKSQTAAPPTTASHMAADRDISDHSNQHSQAQYSQQHNPITRSRNHSVSNQLPHQLDQNLPGSNNPPRGNYFHSSLLDHESDFESSDNHKKQTNPLSLTPAPTRPIQQPYAVQQLNRQREQPTTAAPQRTTRHTRSSSLMGATNESYTSRRGSIARGTRSRGTVDLDITM